MPESSNSSNSRDLNNYLNKKLRKDAVALRQLVAEGKTAEDIQTAKEAMLEDIYRFLATSLGTPPETFDFEYRDEDKNYHIDRNLTPQSFYENMSGWILTIMSASSTHQLPTSLTINRIP